MTRPISIHSALQKVLGGNVLPHDDLLGILEERRLLIRNHQAFSPLMSLGQTAFLGTEDGLMCHALSDDSPEIIVQDYSNKALSLATQGIFAGTPYARRRYYSKEEKEGLETAADGSYATFGIIRPEARWVLIEVEFLNDAARNGYEKATTVWISESEVAEILEKTKIAPWSIWTFMGQKIEQWAAACERQYEIALSAKNLVASENHLFLLIVRS